MAKMNQDFNSVMLEAAREGNECAFWRASEHATEIDWAMQVAALTSQKNIVWMCKLRGATDFDSAMCAAACYGHAKIIELCKELGATDFDRAAKNATDNGYRELARTIEELDWN